MDTKQKKTGAARRGTGRKSTHRRPRRTAARAKRPTPDVVYTPARPFNRNRFLLKLLTVAAVVVAVIFGISIFFKVETVVVSGADKYTAWEIREASGIREGENLLTFSRAAASSRIRTNLPYVDTVRIGIQLPNQVNIQVTELDMVYTMEAEDGTLWLVNSTGRIVEQVSDSEADDHTAILGVMLKAPRQGAQASPINPEDVEGEDASEPTRVGVDAAVRLNTALSIAQYLEANGVIGQAASIDVTDTTDLQLWYGRQYQVLLGDAGELGYKIGCMKTAIDQMDRYQSGVLDVSFTILDQPSYKPF